MDVAVGVENWGEQILALTTTYGLSVLGALLMLIVGWMLSGWAHGAAERWLGRARAIDPTLRPFLASLVKYLILAITVIAVLDRFGVQTASLIAILGAAGLAIGLALQGTLANVAAGIMLLIFRPFRAGDYITASGVGGTVRGITLFTTDLDTPDNVRIIVPNAQLWGTAITNYSFHKTRRCDFVFGIAYGDSIGKAMDLIRDEIGKDGRALPEPAPQVVVGELAESSVNLIVRVWCQASDYWGLKFDLTRAVKERFDAEGISIPFPQRTVHMAAAD